MSDFNPYEVLGVERDADLQTIKKIFKDKSKMLHPDVHGTGDEEAFKALNMAYETLKDPDKRAFFDSHGIIKDQLEANLQKEMVEVICQSFDYVIAVCFERKIKLKNYDVLGEMRSSMQDGKEQIAGIISIVRDQLDELKDMARRVTVADGEKNLFGDRIAELVLDREAAIKKASRQAQVIDKALAEMARYTSEVDLMQSMNTVWVSSSSWGSGAKWDPWKDSSSMNG